MPRTQNGMSGTCRSNTYRMTLFTSQMYDSPAAPHAACAFPHVSLRPAPPRWSSGSPPGCCARSSAAPAATAGRQHAYSTVASYNISWERIANLQIAQEVVHGSFPAAIAARPVDQGGARPAPCGLVGKRYRASFVADGQSESVASLPERLELGPVLQSVTEQVQQDRYGSLQCKALRIADNFTHCDNTGNTDCDKVPPDSAGHCSTQRVRMTLARLNPTRHASHYIGGKFPATHVAACRCNLNGGTKLLFQHTQPSEATF